MKKKFMFMLLIVVLLSFGFTGCKEDEPETQLEKIAFVDDNFDPTKEFIIYENLTFKVTFVAESEFLNMFSFMEIGDSVTGVVKGTTSQWKDDVIEGKAEGMKSNNEELTTILNELGSMDFKLEYLKISGEIIALNVSFPGTGELDIISNTLMGGTYELKH